MFAFIVHKSTRTDNFFPCVLWTDIENTTFKTSGWMAFKRINFLLDYAAVINVYTCF